MTTLQCDHPSRGPHCIMYTTFCMSILLGSDLSGFFLWGYLKSKVYLGGVPTLTTLKDNIFWAMLCISRGMLLSAIENVVYRMQYVVHEKVGHIERGLVLCCIVLLSL
ncbi:hypothetical protein AVEN_219274-1 [Araneus ventricosus]|uniref:Uncharacterized protein n=1 Tax=Araneus ventricosus TaxID=182803 RepID=A0A4Y2QZJ5_ARAVE|nr:hypothetical protein AVEN_219274-1 [Araneus ventricosus]